MKGIRKRIKSMLSVIEAAASEIVMLSSDVPTLDGLERMAVEVLQACDELRRQIDVMDKSALPGGLQGLDCVERLAAILDRDDVSEIEQRFFDWVADQSQGNVAMLLQVWLSKIEKRCIRLSHAIHSLLSMLEGGVFDVSQ